MTHMCSTYNYASELYHEMYTHVLQTHFEKKDIPFKCQVCGLCKATCYIPPTAGKQAHGLRDIMSDQEFKLTHFVQVGADEMEAGTCPDAPLDEEAKADALECPGVQVDIMDLHADGQDNDFPQW